MSKQKGSKRLPVSKKHQNEHTTKTKTHKASDDKDFGLPHVNIDDSSWQSTLAILKFDSSKMCSDFLQSFNVLPDDTTVLTRDMLERNQSKTNKQSTKRLKSDKASLKSKKTKEPVSSASKPRPESSNTGEVDHKSDSTGHLQNICKELKSYILELKKLDLVSAKEGKERNHSVDGKQEIKATDKTHYSGSIKNSSDSLPTQNAVSRNIILFGFDNREIIDEMLKVGLIIKLIIHVKSLMTSSENQRRLSTNKTLKASPFSKSKKGGLESSKKQPNEKTSITSDDFIHKIQISIRDDSYLVYKDIVVVNYITDFTNKTLEQSNKNKQHLLNIVQNVQESWKKYELYKKSLTIVELPSTNKSLCLTNTDLYNALVSMIPSECVSIPIIVHCLLEQVIWNELMSFKDDTTPNANDNNMFKDSNLSSNNEPQVDGYNANTFDILTLSSTKTDIYFKDTLRSEQVIKTEKDLTNITPYLISSANTAKLDTFHIHLPEFNFEKLTTNMMSLSPVHNLWQYFPPQHPDVIKWFKFQIQKLKQCTDNCFITNNDKLFRIFLHESIMNLFINSVSEIQTNSSNNKIILNKNEILYSNKQASTDDNSSLFAREIISSIVSIAPYMSLTEETNEESEISLESSQPSPHSSRLKVFLPLWNVSVRNHESEPCLSPLSQKKCQKENKQALLKSFLYCNAFINLFEQSLFLERNGTLIDRLKHFQFIEDLTPNIMCQSLHQAFQSFSNINYDYFEPTDTILLWFNNNISSNGLTASDLHCGTLETPLCFKDFYKYKLKAKGEFLYISSDKENILNFDDSIYSSEIKENCIKGKLQDNEKNETLKHAYTVYNLTPFRLEVHDYVQSFLSPDSSSVKVIRTNFVNDEEEYSVEVSKNNVSLRYNIYNKRANKNVDIFLNFDEYLRASLCFSWDSSPDVSLNNSSNDLDDNPTLNCVPTITLSSGLKIEIVSINSTIGSFYIRQTYLTKGPSSSNIWDEAYRCYLSNGVMLIFYLNDTVEIFYSNGTRVKCCSFDLNKHSFPDDNIETFPHEQTNETKISKRKKKVKRSKSYSHQRGSGNKLETTVEPDEAKSFSLKTDKKDLPLYEIKEHSVFAWDGEYYKFEKGQKTKQSNSDDLRMAFDEVNQELYWRRSDGTCCLFTPEKLTVSFPDQTVITSTVDDSKEVNDIDTTILSQQEVDSLHDSNIFDNFPSLFGLKSNTTFLFDQISQSSSSYSFNDRSYVFLEPSYVFEHTNYATINYTNGGDQAIIHFPNNIRVKVGKHGLIQIDGCDSERISLTEMGLVFEANVLNDLNRKSHTALNFSNIFTTPQIVCQTVDSFGNVFSIDERGNTHLLKVKKNSSYDEDPLLLHLKYPKKKERFFVFNRDLSGFEIINEKYDEECPKVLKQPLTKNNTVETETFSLYKEYFLFQTESENYVFKHKEKILPTFIRRKDLIKRNKMPKEVWFLRQLSKCDKNTTTTELKSKVKELPKAVVLKKLVKIKTESVSFSLLFSKCLESYIGINEQILNKYSNMFPEDVRNSAIYSEGEEHKKDALGFKSYHVMDNLPIVLSQ